MNNKNASCPHCSWTPREKADWNCLQCGEEFDAFASLARCPKCGFQHEKIICPAHAGGCDQVAPFLDWIDEDMDRKLRGLDIFKI